MGDILTCWDVQPCVHLLMQRPKFLRPYGTIYQAINTDTLRAQNMETLPYFNQVINSPTHSGTMCFTGFIFGMSEILFMCYGLNPMDKHLPKCLGQGNVFAERLVKLVKSYLI